MKKSLIALLLLLSTVAQGCAHSEPSVAQKAAKLLIVGVNGQSLASDNPIIEDIAEKGVSGIILFGHNVATTEQVADPRGQLTKFIADLKAVRSEPLIISIDQEGGLVNRLKEKSGFKPMASHRTVGALESAEKVRTEAANIAHEVASIGVNFNFAPCVDVDVNPTCPVIGHFGRSFSPDEKRVAECASIYVEEHHKRGVLTSLKHFLGHGNSLDDSHYGLTDITATWQERELFPYQNLMESGLCDAVMVSHLYNANFDEEYPATLSRKILQGLLREQLGWQGVVVSDDMQMRAITDHYGFEEAVTLGLNAGVDLFIIGCNIKREDYNVVDKFISVIEAGVESGAISMETLDQAVARVEKMVSKIE
ncbi:MAG: glycoside hydrolase family 3 N-terminal domain-containing protein [Rikenellaceae bacterium]